MMSISRREYGPDQTDMTMAAKPARNTEIDANAATSLMKYDISLSFSYMFFLCSILVLTSTPFCHFFGCAFLRSTFPCPEPTMRLPTTALCFLLVAGIAATPAAAADRIVDAVVGDWNKDGASDLAVLFVPSADGEEERGTGEIGIGIYLRSSERDLLMPAVSLPDKFWGNAPAGTDGIYGQEPSIKATDSGSILVTTHNDAIGRDRWRQVLTIAYRAGDFIVAGFTYEYYDTLDLERHGSCDLNLLSGKGVVNDKPVKVDPLRTTLKDWQDETGFKACGFDLQ
jgi:hypothetical protein